MEKNKARDRIANINDIVEARFSDSLTDVIPKKVNIENVNTPRAYMIRLSRNGFVIVLFI